MIMKTFKHNNTFTYIYVNIRLYMSLYSQKNISKFEEVFSIFVFVILFILITFNTQININMELWTNIAEFVTIKLGLLKINLVGYNKILYNIISYRSFYQFKSYLLISLIWFIVISISFILSNIHYLILILLIKIWTKTFVLNFLSKHLITSTHKFSLSRSNIMISIQKIMKLISNNLKTIIYYIGKSILISILIIIVLRSTVHILLMGGTGENYILGAQAVEVQGIILILPLPIYNYVLNLVLKKLKSQVITGEDYYFYNNFVVNNTNLYRIFYILCIRYIVMNYYYIYLVTVTILILLLILIFLVYNRFILYKSEDINDSCISYGNKGGLLLKSQGGEVMALITSFVAIAPILQEACDRGYAEYFAPNGRRSKYVHWKKIPFHKPGEYYIGEKTVNIRWKADNLFAKPSDLPVNIEHNRAIEDHKQKITNSPIFNITYYQKNNGATLRSPHKWGLRPVNFFSNKDFYGSISSTMTRGKFLIINFIRRDLDASVFMPTFYLPDNTVEGQQRIRDLVNTLELRYNILLPRGTERKNGYVIFTQAQPLGNDGLIKVWRPSIEYTQPESLKKKSTVSGYYKLGDESMVRLDEFNYEGAISMIKKLASINAIDKLNRDEPNKHLKDLITNEVMADRLWRSILDFFIHTGKDYNIEGKYDINKFKLEREEVESDRFESIERLIKKLEQERKRYISLTKKGKRKALSMEQKLWAVLREYDKSMRSNHKTFGTKWQTTLARRDKPIQSFLWEREKISCHAYFSLAPQGVIEGFKGTNQGLGELNTEFNLNLNASRNDAIITLVDKWNRWIHLHNGPVSTYVVSISRFTFEFFEVRPSRDIFKYRSEDYPYNNADVFSIIDTKNDNSKFLALLDKGYEEKVIPKHDYSFLDDKDEHSIRKIMDLIYRNDNGYISYKSDIPNNENVLINRMNNLTLTNRVPRKVKVFKVGSVLSNNNQGIKRRFSKWIIKPAQTANFGMPQRKVDAEWNAEDLERFGNKKIPWVRALYAKISKQDQIARMKALMNHPIFDYNEVLRLESDARDLRRFHYRFNSKFKIRNPKEVIVIEDVAKPDFLSLGNIRPSRNTRQEPADFLSIGNMQPNASRNLQQEPDFLSIGNINSKGKEVVRQQPEVININDNDFVTEQEPDFLSIGNMGPGVEQNFSIEQQLLENFDSSIEEQQLFLDSLNYNFDLSYEEQLAHIQNFEPMVEDDIYEADREGSSSRKRKR